MTEILNPPKSARQTPGQLFARLGFLNRRVKIEGFVDNIAANEVMGWAYDRQWPDRRVHIVARSEGKVVAEALADLPRGDLASAGKGDGRHGFRLRLPNGLAGLDGTVEAVARPRNQVLQRGQLRVPEPVAVPKLEKAKPAANRVGVIERLRGRQLTGWAVDPKHPESPAQLDIFDGERYLGSAACGSIRPDVGEAGGPLGARAFLFEVPNDGNPLRPESLRVRVVGGRHDLRRSKAFAGTTEDPAGVDAPSAPPPTATDGEPVERNARPATAVHRPERIERIEGVALIICGPDPENRLGETRASVAAVCGPDQAPTVLCGRTPAEAGSALTQVLDGCSEVMLLAPGQTLKGPDLQHLLALRPFGDVWVFGARADQAALFTWQSGAEIRSLAVRASTLRAWPKAAEALAQGDFAALAAWSCEQGHRWEALPHDPVDGPSLRGAAPGRPLCASPKRVTLGLWGDWAGSVPPGLAALLEGCHGLDVEILCPDEALGAAVRALDTAALGSLDLRIVPSTHRPGSGSHLKALAGAATGQVVVLAHSGLVYSRPDTLPEVLTWALAEGVGCVTVPITSATSVLSGLVLDSADGQVLVCTGRAPEAPRGCVPVLAAPAEFMVVSRRALAAMEGLDAGRFPERHADLDLGIRLLGRHRHCLSIDRLGASLPGANDLKGRGDPITATEALLLGISPPCETGATTVLGRR